MRLELQAERLLVAGDGAGQEFGEGVVRFAIGFHDNLGCNSGPGVSILWRNRQVGPGMLTNRKTILNQSGSRSETIRPDAHLIR